MLALLAAAGMALALFLAAVGWFVFIPGKPLPEGPRGVGRLEAALRDRQGRAIPITIWYPTAAAARNAAPLENAPFDATTNTPLILYSPGWAATRRQSSAQTENLASHGFVVVACDDYANDVTTDPDFGAGFDVSSDGAMAASMERAGRHVTTQGDRIVAVLNALAAGQVPMLAGRLDLGRVGVLGLSVGGASGLQAALIDPRIVAVLNLDGGLFGPPATRVGSHAYFLVSSREAFPSQADLSSTDAETRNNALVSVRDLPLNARRMERPGNYWALLETADHGDLSDELFVFSRRTLFRSNSQRRAVHAAIRAYEIAFFQSALGGDPEPLRVLLGQTLQNTRWINATWTPAGAAKARQ
ncbi:hypothetical protein BH11PSE3_BH11PSE3_20350 [soil metagenome]